LYPTLLDLCGLPEQAGLDGQSLKPLLKNPKLEWDRPVVMTYGPNNHAVQTERWRYIQYHDGGKELYDQDRDPNEWTNLAKVPEHQEIVRKLQGALPRSIATKPRK
ncbi:MAG: sulfatase/phosphatase domain-containing protein, partial [Verrucomicrobiia bacterium]